MSRDYKKERDAIIRRWYGGYAQPSNPRRSRSWNGHPITPADCLGIPTPVNSPFSLFGHCLAWKYGMNGDGYGLLTIDGKQRLAHRVVFVQTRGQIPENRQVNHLCNRPYCIQPSHLYAGTVQDNKDDSQIFNKEELLHAPWILHLPDRTETDDPLLRRLLESDRYDGAESWEPEVQPAQFPLEEFRCPGHDFAITMFGGNSRICRICETSEFKENMIDETGVPLLIAELCPASQTVNPILEKAFNSKFAGESHRETRRLANLRSYRGLGNGSHYLRNCECRHCGRDRKAFRTSIDALLTREESELLDACDRLEPHITKALEEASAHVMEVWARAAGLDGDQARALKEHYKACSNTEVELAGTSRSIESELGYLLYALTEFDSRSDMIEDQMAQMLLYRWNMVRVREEDVELMDRTILPVAREAVKGLTQAWEKETDELTRPYMESKPELYQDVSYLVYVLAMKHIWEHLRHEFFGRNSFGEQKPHPHADCAVSIVETGHVKPFPNEFEEGMGYRPVETTPPDNSDYSA